MNKGQLAYCCGRCGELVVGGKYADCPNCGGSFPHNEVSVYGNSGNSDENKDKKEKKKENFFCQNCGQTAGHLSAKEICPNCLSIEPFIKAA